MSVSGLPDGKFAARHVRRRVEDNDELWQDDTKAPDDKVVLLKLRDSISAALSETVFRKRLAKV